MADTFDATKPNEDAGIILDEQGRVKEWRPLFGEVIWVQPNPDLRPACLTMGVGNREEEET